MNDKNSSKTLIRLAVILIAAILILFTVSPFLLSGRAIDKLTPTVLALTEVPEATEEFPSPPLEPFESTGSEESLEIDQDRLKVGELEIEYPPVMTMRASETIALSVFIPVKIASADLLEFERILIPPNQPGIIDRLSNFSTNTVLYDSMRATLRSTSFTIEPLQSDESRFVDIDTPNTRTTWQWIVQAPDFPGEQVIAVSVYLGNESQPSWVGSIQIEVGTPTNTPPSPPTSTATPVPVLKRIGNQIVDSISIEVCLGIPALILAIITLVDQVKKRMKKRKRKSTK